MSQRSSSHLLQPQSDNDSCSFYGFPPKYYEAKYPNRGSPELANKILGLLGDAGIKAKGVTRGLDHGVWSGFHVGRLCCASLIM